MKVIAICALLAAMPAFAQTLHYDEPQPDQVKIAQLTDAEAAQLASESDTKQKALKAYFEARDAYSRTKASLEDKYDAHEVSATCGGAKTDVEWKGKFIVVEHYETANSLSCYIGTTGSVAFATGTGSLEGGR
jgi:hypothetical protein